VTRAKRATSVLFLTATSIARAWRRRSLPSSDKDALLFFGLPAVVTLTQQLIDHWP